MPDFVANGVRLRYEMFGERGPSNNPAQWNRHDDRALEAHDRGARREILRILCHDLRGQTLSDKPSGDYSFEQHAADLAALLDGLGISKAHIVGTSYGSEVAMAFAIAYPERCESLSVIDGVSELDPLLRAAAESWMAAALCDPQSLLQDAHALDLFGGIYRKKPRRPRWRGKNPWQNFRGNGSKPSPGCARLFSGST